MAEKTVHLTIADSEAAIRYLGEMQSRPMDPIHEPIQNLLDENAHNIEVILDAKKKRIRIRGDAKPITSEREARRILTSICSSKKRGKLGEKGVGMLSFVTVGSSMTTLSQKDGHVVWFTLNRDAPASGRVGRDKGNRLPFAGTEILIKGVSARNMKYRFGEDRVIRDLKRRWGAFLVKGITLSVNGRDVGSFTPPLQGDPFERRINVKELGKMTRIEVSLMILKEPSDLATVSVTHRGQANFMIPDVPLFEDHNAFTQGMLHGTITGDIAPLNASRTGFQEGRAFEIWAERIIDLEEELGRLIAERLRTAAEARNAAMLNKWMRHLRDVFMHSELAATTTSAGEGEEEGWAETRDGSGDGDGAGGGGDAGREAGDGSRKGEGGRLPTVPYADFTKARPHIRVVRERKTFRINVNHPDYITASKVRGGTQRYLRELCMHEAYVYSLEGKAREWYVERYDEFMEYWVRAFIR